MKMDLEKECFWFYVLSMRSASQVALVINNMSANAEDVGSIPGLGRSPGGGHGNPFQYFCLVNLMDRGAWWVTVRSVAKSRTRLKRLSMHACTHL